MGLSPPNEPGPHALFHEEQRICERCDTRTTRHSRVSWGVDAVEEHLCPDGQYGRLELVHPRPGREVKDPTVVDFSTDKEEPRPL